MFNLNASRLRAVAVLAAAGTLALGVLSAGPALAQAQPACGDTLTASVTLTADLDCSAYTAGPALMITANGVTLNLGGYTITGPGGASGTAGVQIGTSTQAPASDTVENGTIADFYQDIAVAAARSLHLTSLDLQFDTPDSYTGIYAENLDRGTFSSITAQDAEDGIDLDATALVTITGANLNGSTYGVYGEANTGDTISHSTASGGGSSAYGFYDEYSQDSYVSDTADGDEDGFYIDGDESGGTKLESDIADGNSADGFSLYYNFNYYYYYYGAGAPRESVTADTANDNGSDGFYDYYSLGATWTGDQASYNGADGINIAYPGRYTVKDNTTSYNAGTGIYLADNYSGDYNVKTASDNTATYNGDYGLYADYAAPGSANTALNNTPYDCFNFVCKAGSMTTRQGTLDRPSAPSAPRP